MSTHDAPHEDTLATEVFDRDPAGDTTSPASPPAPTASSPPPTTEPAERPYLSGPAPFAIVLGLLGLLVAGAVLVAELTQVTLRMDNLGPWTVVAAGVVILVVGALGVRASRPKD